MIREVEITAGLQSGDSIGQMIRPPFVVGIRERQIADVLAVQPVDASIAGGAWARVRLRDLVPANSVAIPEGSHLCSDRNRRLIIHDNHLDLNTGCKVLIADACQGARQDARLALVEGNDDADVQMGSSCLN